MRSFVGLLLMFFPSFPSFCKILISPNPKSPIPLAIFQTHSSRQGRRCFTYEPPVPWIKETQRGYVTFPWSS